MEQLFYKPENYNIIELPGIQKGYAVGFDPYKKDVEEPAVVMIFDSTGKVIAHQKQPVGYPLSKLICHMQISNYRNTQ